jgi:NADPH2:quinone reductase
MENAIGLMGSGALKAPPTQVLPLDEVRHAHEKLDAGSALGKLVLRP